MRKHSARKWLHFILDLLPVIILPIFALYEINHDHNEPIVVTDGAWEHREKYETNDVITSDDLISGNIYKFNFLNANRNLIIQDGFMTFILESPLQFQYGTITSLNTSTEFDNFDNIILCITDDGGGDLYLDTYYSLDQYDGLESSNTYGLNNIVFTNNFYAVLYEFSGNINPTYIERSDFNVIEYVYNENHVYDDTDIGSQMMYALYKPVKNYFNFNNVFNFGDIYHWFEANIFHGTAPMSFFIVWNIVLYQFVMDLVFLIYGLFMWFIDMCEKLMDKPLNSTK